MRLTGFALAIAGLATAGPAIAGDVVEAGKGEKILLTRQTPAPPHPALRAALSHQGRGPTPNYLSAMPSPQGERLSRCLLIATSQASLTVKVRELGEGSRRSMSPRRRGAVGEGELRPYKVVSDSVPNPLGGLEGDSQRGKTIVVDRRKGNCLICHSFPIEDEPFQGEIGPPLAGVGSRLTKGQIRLRLIDQSRINPETIMPPYYRVEDLTNVAPEYRGRPALDAQEIEDVAAYLASLTE